MLSCERSLPYVDLIEDHTPFASIGYHMIPDQFTVRVFPFGYFRVSNRNTAHFTPIGYFRTWSLWQSFQGDKHLVAGVVMVVGLNLNRDMMTPLLVWPSSVFFLCPAFAILALLNFALALSLGL